MRRFLRGGSRDPEVIPEEWLFERMRMVRDELLERTDVTQLPDFPADTVAWAEWRQMLRDVPATWVAEEVWTFDNPAVPWAERKKVLFSEPDDE